MSSYFLKRKSKRRRIWLFSHFPCSGHLHPVLKLSVWTEKKGTGITTETSHHQLKLPQPVINWCRFTLPVWIIGNKVDAWINTPLPHQLPLREIIFSENLIHMGYNYSGKLFSCEFYQSRILIPIDIWNKWCQLTCGWKGGKLILVGKVK